MFAARRMDLDEAAEQLYGLLPDQFVAERTALARLARSSGDRELAADVAALRRPTVGAWALNTLARREPTLVVQLLELGEQLRAAQASLAGEEMRALTQQRGQLTQTLARRAVALAAQAGRPVGDAVEAEVEQTLRAAVTDPAVGDAVRSGRMTTGLEYAGLGEVDLTGVVATPLPRPQQSVREPTAKRAVSQRKRKEPSAPRPPRDGPSTLDVRRASKEVDQARDAERRAAVALDRREADRLEADARIEELSARLADLEGQLSRARTAAAEARRDVREARRTHESATRALERAAAALGRLDQR